MDADSATVLFVSRAIYYFHVKKWPDINPIRNIFEAKVGWASKGGSLRQNYYRKFVASAGLSRPYIVRFIYRFPLSETCHINLDLASKGLWKLMCCNQRALIMHALHRAKKILW